MAHDSWGVVAEWHNPSNPTASQIRAMRSTQPRNRLAYSVPSSATPFSSQVYRTRYWHNAALMVIANRADIPGGPPVLRDWARSVRLRLGSPVWGVDWRFALSPLALPSELCMLIPTVPNGGAVLFWGNAIPSQSVHCFRYF